MRAGRTDFSFSIEPGRSNNIVDTVKSRGTTTSHLYVRCTLRTRPLGVKVKGLLRLFIYFRKQNTFSLAKLGFAQPSPPRSRIVQSSAKFSEPPLPKNMHPDISSERRELRAQNTGKTNTIPARNGARYILSDASRQVTHGKIALVNTRTKVHHFETFTEPPTNDDLEEYAIAKAMEHATQRPNPHLTFIFIDWQRTLRNYANNTLNPVTASLVPRANVRHPTRNSAFYRAPGHQGVQGNETAHCFNRENSPVPAT